VDIRLRDGEQQELIQGLTAGTFDLAFLYDHDLDGTIEAEPLMPPQKPYVLLPEKHRFAGQAQVSLRDLCREPMILLDVAPSRTYFVNLFNRWGSRRISSSVRRRSKWCAGWWGRASAFAAGDPAAYGVHL
jgi:DNA-binding transcriptional LysR family regulator